VWHCESLFDSISETICPFPISVNLHALPIDIAILAIVLKRARPGPVGQPGARSIRDWNRVGFKKNRENQNSRWPTWLTRRPGKTRSKTRLQPIDFCFFYKNDVVLILKKIRIDPGDLVTRSKPEIQFLDRVDHQAEF
jgi:hypothetical protein